MKVQGALQSVAIFGFLKEQQVMAQYRLSTVNLMK